MKVEMPHSGAPSALIKNIEVVIPFSVPLCCATTSPVLRDPVVGKNHNVSHYDILLSLDLKFKGQEGAGPTISFCRLSRLLPNL
jgi:hypothetical protein